MAQRVTVRGIIYKDGKMFAQTLKKGDGVADFWCTPGGGLDEGESLLDGLRREMIEETGVAPEIGRLLYVQQYAEDGTEFLEFFFHIINAQDYEHEIDLASTSHGSIEVAEHGFIDVKRERVLPEFLQTVDLEADTTTLSGVGVMSYL